MSHKNNRTLQNSFLRTCREKGEKREREGGLKNDNL